jgi:hypothetical protein
MTLDEALDYFGSGYKMCRLLNISPNNYTRWTAKGFIPLHHQHKLQELSNGIVKARLCDVRTRFGGNEGSVV